MKVKGQKKTKTLRMEIKHNKHKKKTIKKRKQIKIIKK